jgi:UDP-N-acetylmuramyl pentapeptide synthase
MMNRELQQVENKDADQGLTGLVGRSRAGSSGFVASSHSFFDGDNFSNVAETGASAALVSDSPRAMNSLRVLSLLQVRNTLTKLHKLAPIYRQLMPPRPLWN